MWILSLLDLKVGSTIKMESINIKLIDTPYVNSAIPGQLMYAFVVLRCDIMLLREIS